MSQVVQVHTWSGENAVLVSEHVKILHVCLPIIPYSKCEAKVNPRQEGHHWLQVVRENALLVRPRHLVGALRCAAPF